MLLLHQSTCTCTSAFEMSAWRKPQLRHLMSHPGTKCPNSLSICFLSSALWLHCNGHFNSMLAYWSICGVPALCRVLIVWGDYPQYEGFPKVWITGSMNQKVINLIDHKTSEMHNVYSNEGDDRGLQPPWRHKAVCCAVLCNRLSYVNNGWRNRGIRM